MAFDLKVIKSCPVPFSCAAPAFTRFSIFHASGRAFLDPKPVILSPCCIHIFAILRSLPPAALGACVLLSLRTTNPI